MKGAPHNCLDDARAAMKLVLARIEGAVNGVIPVVSEEVVNNFLANFFQMLFHLKFVSSNL